MHKEISYSLLTDFYELTMMQGYFLTNPHEEAVFEVFYRRQPFDGGYSIFAGLGPLLETIELLKFNNEDIAYLESRGIFRNEFLKHLSDFTFSGDIYSISEGAAIFPNEPLMRIHGNLMEVQLIETMVLNFINFQSLIATKTARIINAAGGLPVLEFGLRRAQGMNGAMSAARASIIGGAAATSNTCAGKLFDIPVSGTMAHSWVMSFPSELESFEKYIEIYPDRPVLLVDTFSTLESGVPNAIKVFKELQASAPSLMAIRIDSGDLEYLSKKAREMLDDAGLSEVKIFVSSDLDEWIIEQLRNKNSPIDAWGVGTRLITGWGDPAFTGVYKIVAKKTGQSFEPCIKISNQPEKITNPGVKNIMRFFDNDGQMLADLIYLEEEKDALLKAVSKKGPLRFNHPSTEYAHFIMKDYDTAAPLLKEVMKNGRRSVNLPALNDIARYCREEMLKLDETYKRLLNPHRYRVSLTDSLKNLKTELIRAHEK